MSQMKVPYGEFEIQCMDEHAAKHALHEKQKELTYKVEQMQAKIKHFQNTTKELHRLLNLQQVITELVRIGCDEDTDYIIHELKLTRVSDFAHIPYNKFQAIGRAIGGGEKSKLLGQLMARERGVARRREDKEGVDVENKQAVQIGFDRLKV